MMIAFTLLILYHKSGKIDPVVKKSFGNTNQLTVLTIFIFARLHPVHSFFRNSPLPAEMV